MPSSEHFSVRGQSPYKQKNGIFEVEFAIIAAKPTDDGRPCGSDAAKRVAAKRNGSSRQDDDGSSKNAA